MADAHAALAAYPRAFRRASALTGMVGGLLATAYGVLTLRLAAEATRPLVFLATLAVTAGLLVTELRSQRRTATLRGLANGDLPPSRDYLKLAVEEALSVPDMLFWTGLVAWLVGATFTAVGVKFWVKADWAPALRLIGFGFLFGPLSCLLAYFQDTLRARETVRTLCKLGLTPADVIAASPPRRAQLRARLVVFTAICVIVPAALTADMTSSFAQRGFEDVVKLDLGEPQQREADQLRRDAVTKVALMSGLVFLLAVFTAYVGGTALGAPMQDIAEEATRIARGDLENPRPIPAEDEVWAVSAAFSAMQAHLTQVLTKLKRAGIQIGGTTEQIVATSAKYEAGAAEQATALNETSATTEELARSARQIAENAGAVAEIAQKTLNAAQAGQDSAEAFSQSMARMRQDNQAIAGSVVRLNKRVQQIGRIVEFINGVADKSDLLALNAELEGTKAGEVGRGFSLVAAEMRRLAENVIESTKEIEGLIEEIREATSAAVTATEAGVVATDSGGLLANQVAASLKEIVSLAGQTSDAVRSISLATQQQQTGTDQLAEAMSDILRVTQQSLAATKQVTSANVDLSALALTLKAVVERFRIGGL